MEFIDNRKIGNEFGEGDIIVNECGRYMILFNGSNYQWMILDSGYLCDVEFKTVGEVIEYLEGSEIFKNDRFKLILE